MSNERADLSGNTEQFKAFVQTPPENAAPSRAPLVIGVVVALALVAVVAYVAFG
jgi:hypothetical protein